MPGAVTRTRISGLSIVLAVAIGVGIEAPPPLNSADPVGLLRGDWPGDLPLRREALIQQAVGDRMGILVTYSRETRRPQRRSPVP